MKEENIDKLYQKQLKDFSEIPDERVWKSISASLDKKDKSKRVIPIWWKMGGVAALLLLSLLIFNQLSDRETNEIITDIDIPEKNPENKNNIINIETPEDLEITDPLTETSVGSKEDKFFNNSKNKAVSEGIASEDNTILPGESSKTLQENQLVSSANKTVEKDNISITEKSNETQKRQEQGLLTANNINKVADKNENNLGIISEVPAPKTNDDSLAENIEIKEKKSIESDNKKSIFDEIKKSEDLAVVEESNSEKWEVGPSIGPVYFNSFGTGSPIHSNFVPNSKTGNVNLSYGIGVAYKVGKRIKIRSGLNKVDYSYNTNDISFSASLTASTNAQIDNINYVPTSQNLVVRNLQESNLLQRTSNIEIAAPNPAREGTMVQDFGYLELPLELNYAIIDKKFGFDVIGGISSLFLVNNAVILESGVGEMEMGEANNLNSVNLSTNIGLGFNYNFTSKIQLSLEPMFKYQLNTFSQTAGTFQPFSVGVFTGLSFKL